MEDASHNPSSSDNVARLKTELTSVLASSSVSPEYRDAIMALFAGLEAAERDADNARWVLLSAMDAVQHPLFIHDREYRIVRANRAYAKYAGMTVQEVIGRPYWQVFPKLDGPHPICADALMEKTAREEEHTLPSGETFLVRYLPILDEEGTFLYSLHIMVDVTGKQQAEAEQRFLSEALRQAAEAVLVLDAEGRISYLNPAFYHQFGYSPEEIIGQPISILSVPEKVSAIQPLSVLAELHKHGQWRGETVRLAKDGTAIPIMLSASVIRDNHHAILGYVGNYIDLRSLKAAERKLRDSEEQFRAISTAALDAIIMLDDKGHVVFLNDAAIRTFGYTAEDVMGQEAHMLLAPEKYHAAYQKAWPHFVANGTGPAIDKVLELEAKRKDGTVFPVELSVSALRLKGRWHAVGILRDISERRKAEGKLKLFRDLLDQSTDGIYIVEPSTGRILDANSAACNDLGYTREEILHLGVLDIQSDLPNIEAWQEHLQELRAQNTTLFTFDALRKDGEKFPVEVSVKDVTVDNNSYIIAVVRDVAERNASERALQHALRAQRTLSACNQILIHAAQEQQLLEDMCRTVINEGGYRLSWIGLVEHDEAKSVRPAAAAGFEEGYLESLQITWRDNERGQGPTGRAVRLGMPQVAQDILTDPRFRPWREQALKRGYSASIALPLMEDDGAVFGVLNIYSVESQAFDDNEVLLLQELADDLAFGVLALRTRQERNYFQKENLKSALRLKESLFDTIHAVALTVEKRDPYTAGHQSRVAELSTAIAREMGLDNDRIEGLMLGAMIHDIGKISVPAEILNRPGRLSKHEFGLIKTHADAGYDIMKDVKFPWPVAEMILQHHERMDGSGYPLGLKGEAIITEARIIAVADVVEAITAHRPYRAALGIEVALTEIENNRGSIYDSAVVDACLRLFREKGYSLDKS